MRERVCKNCGGRRYVVVGQNMVKCQFCGTLYVDEQASKEEEFLTVSAFEQLRALKFEQATKEFEKVLSLYPLSFEAFFGKSLAKNKIVLYNNKRGMRMYPKFFGDSIPNLEEDEDFQNAIKNAPQDTINEYNEIAKRVEKIREGYEKINKEKKVDIFVCAMNFDKANPDEKIMQSISSFNEEGYSTYFLQGLEKKEKEEETFYALQTASAFVLFANNEDGYSQPEYKNLFDRYTYFVSQRKKYSKSFVVALDAEKFENSSLPDELKFCKSFVDLNSTTFLQDITEKVKTEIKNAVKETAKIETKTIERVEPEKKTYFDVDDSIDPVELGHYQVENMETSEENRLRWIFLSLKNGDFGAAEQTIAEELAKDENNAEVLFAQLLCEKKMHTAGEFFGSIGNFTDKEKIDKILSLSTKEFAEMFVDNWEKLIISLDSVEYYNAFLTYLAQYTSPMREEFINKAEQKAVETQDEELIDKVLRCFGKEEVDRFADFYFMLAQHSDNQEYYQKVLDIDMGHEQSNFALLLSHFKTNENKLLYRNREEIEESLKYLNDSTRAQFVLAVVNMVLPIAFLDLDEAQRQIDFYLGYVSENEKLVDILKKIIESFEQMGYFTVAEKYISIAISKSKDQAELYWMLIKAKAHCKSDTELISSVVDVAKMDEWGTLLNIASDEQTEKYAGIVNKSHLYTGERQPIKEEFLDKSALKLALLDFLNRNNAILLGIQKEEGAKADRGVNYFKLQFVPFENYCDSLDNVKNFEEYKELAERIYERLELLGLSLTSSVSAIAVAEKSEGLKGVHTEAIDRRTKTNKIIKDAQRQTNHKKFWSKFLYIVFELIPNLLAFVLLLLISIDPKMVYLSVSQGFVIGLTLYCVAVGIGNLIIYACLKKKLGMLWRLGYLLLICLAFVNLIFMSTDFYFLNAKIEIKNAGEMAALVKNAPYGNFVLSDDLDMSQRQWNAVEFAGNFEGNNHTIYGLNFKENAVTVALFSKNTGTIKNLTVKLQDKTAENAYKETQEFAGVAAINRGTIENVSTSGNVAINTSANLLAGGIVGENYGQITNCNSKIQVALEISGANINAGGIAGRANGENKVNKNSSDFKIIVDAKEKAKAYIGGIVGSAVGEDGVLAQNYANVDIRIDGSVSFTDLGGLVGNGYGSSENNYATGTISSSAVSTGACLGGLYGQYLSAKIQNSINHSYSRVTVSSEEDSDKLGGLVGGKYGNIKNSYTSTTNELCGGEKVHPYASIENCENNVSGYKDSFEFSSDIWNFGSLATFPTLK